MTSNYQIYLVLITVFISIVLILNVIHQNQSIERNHLTKVETSSRRLFDVPYDDKSEEVVKSIEKGMNELFESIKSLNSIKEMAHASWDTTSGATATYYPKYLIKFLNTTVNWPNLYTLSTSYNGSAVFFGLYPNQTGGSTGSYLCYDYCKHFVYLGDFKTKVGSNSDASRNYLILGGYAFFNFVIDWNKLNGSVTYRYFYNDYMQLKPISTATDSTGASIVVIAVSISGPDLAFAFGSTDYGATFTLIYSQVYNSKYIPTVKGIGYSFFGAIDNNLFVTTKATAVKSASHWTAITALSTVFGKSYYISDLAFGITTSNLYVITTGSNYIYGSHNGGTTWAKTAYKSTWTSISTDFSGKYVYAVDKNRGLLYSKDFGSKFTNIFKATSSSPVYNVGVSYDGQYAYFYYNYNAYAYSSYNVKLYFSKSIENFDTNFVVDYDDSSR